jgi:hypothetical protein
MPINKEVLARMMGNRMGGMVSGMPKTQLFPQPPVGPGIQGGGPMSFGPPPAPPRMAPPLQGPLIGGTMPPPGAQPPQVSPIGAPAGPLTRQTTQAGMLRRPVTPSRGMSG